MAEILLWFFAALGICFLGLEAFRAFESLIIDALAQKFDRIYIEDGSDNTHTVL